MQPSAECLSSRKNGGQEYFAAQAKLNPGPFLALIGKVLPTQIAGVLGEPIEHKMTIEEQRRRAVAEIEASFGAVTGKGMKLAKPHSSAERFHGEYWAMTGMGASRAVPAGKAERSL